MASVINMRKKIDVYVKDPVKLSDDLDTQLLGWKVNLVRPFGNCYRAACKSIEKKLKDAEQEHKKAQEEAQKMVEVGMAITCFILDVAASAAITKLAGNVSRIQSTKPIDFFVNETESAGQAAVKFLSQNQAFSDIVIGNLATKTLDTLKGKGIDLFKSESKKAQTSIQSDTSLITFFQGNTKDPETFQNKLLARYEKSIFTLKTLYANGIRDNTDLDEASRRALITLFVSMPIARPPSYEFPASAMVNYVESILWMHHCLRVQAGAKGKIGHLGGGVPGLRMRIAYKINQTIFPPRYITNAGSETSTKSTVDRLYMLWDGHVGPYHVKPMKEIAGINGKSIQSIVTALFAKGS